MKKLMKLLRAVSEKREALNKYLSDTAQPDQARVTELRGDLDKAEQEFRSAATTFEEASEGEPETRQLSDKIELRAYMNAAVRGEKVTGAEAEFNKEVGLNDIGAVPWEAIEPRQREDRAGETSVAAAAIGHPQQAVLGRIFQRSRTSFLGMRMPMVSAGEPVYPVLTGGASGSAHEEGVSVSNEAATFAGVTVGPTRLSARYVWRIEDAARFPVEDALRADIREVMNVLLDTQVINGDGGADGDMSGIITELGAAAAEGTKTDFNQVLTKHYNYVDGAAAANVSEVRTLMGIGTYAFLATLFQGASGEQIYSLLGRLGIQTATWAGIAAPAANVQQAIQTRRGTDAIVPVWQGVTMIRDPYTGAAKGEVALTAHMLANFKFLRTDNWRKIAFKLA